MSGELRTSVGYWNCFLYTTHGGEAELRNDGFAVEPGHFGYLLGIAIFFNLIRNKFVINKKLIVLVIAGLTTMSTTFYISLAVILYFYSLNNKMSIFLKLGIFCIVIIVSWKIANSNLVVDKIDKTSNRTEEQFKYGYKNIEYGGSMNRFGAFQIEALNFKNYPLGHSVNSSGLIHASDGEVVGGPNGLAAFISFWGISGLFFLIFSLKEWSKIFYKYYKLKRGVYIFPIIFLMYFFSNSISRDVLVFVLLFYPLLEYRSTQRNKLNNKAI